MEDRLEFIMDLAQQAGASYVEARYQCDAHESCLLKNGEPEVSSRDTKRGIGIRVLAGGALAFGATNRMDRRTLRSLTKRVVDNAKRSARMRKAPIEFAEAEAGQGKVELRPRVSFDAVSLESRIDLLRDTDMEATEVATGGGVELPGRFMELDTLVTEKMLMTSEGARVHSRMPRATIQMVLTAATAAGSAQRILSRGEASGWECVERWDLPRMVREETTMLVDVLLNGKAMRPMTGDVVLGPEVVGLVAHESSGHPAEADRIMGREAAQAGETYLEADSLGMRVGSDVVNVVEDPAIPNSFGYYLYDDEGVMARKRHLIKEGVINEFLHNRETAAAFGVPSNASARSVAYNREPIVRMANTYVDRGDHSFEELVEDVKEGIYIRNFMEWNIDDRRFNQRYVGLDAFRIEDGELRERVRNPAIEITTTGLWGAVDAVGRDLEFTSAFCGKGDPMQGIPVWTGGPHIRLRDIRLEGSP